jgi:hypothetical protein
MDEFDSILDIANDSIDEKEKSIENVQINADRTKHRKSRKESKKTSEKICNLYESNGERRGRARTKQK